MQTIKKKDVLTEYENASRWVEWVMYTYQLR